MSAVQDMCFNVGIANATEHKLVCLSSFVRRTDGRSESSNDSDVTTEHHFVASSVLHSRSLLQNPRCCCCWRITLDLDVDYCPSANCLYSTVYRTPLSATKWNELYIQKLTDVKINELLEVRPGGVNLWSRTCVDPRPPV